MVFIVAPKLNKPIDATASGFSIGAIAESSIGVPLV